MYLSSNKINVANANTNAIASYTDTASPPFNEFAGDLANRLLVTLPDYSFIISHAAECVDSFFNCRIEPGHGIIETVVKVTI